MKTIKNLLAGATFAATLVAGSQFATAGEDLRFAGSFPVKHSSSVAMSEHFTAKLAELTGGELTASTFPAHQLGGPKENVDQVRTGVIFGSWIGMAYLSRTIPELEAVSLPFVYKDRETAFRVIDGQVSELLNEKLAEKGFVGLGYMELGPRNVTNDRQPIKTIEDFKGLKIRLQPNETHLSTFREIGASPVAMGADEVYSALQQGVINGQENPFSIIATAKYDEVQGYLSDTGHFFDFIILTANKEKYDALSPEHQKALKESINYAIAWQREEAKRQDAESLAALQKTMEFTPISDDLRAELKVATAGVVEELKKRIGTDIIDIVIAEAAK